MSARIAVTRRFAVYDPFSKRSYLIDTDTEVSVPPFCNKLYRQRLKLAAGNFTVQVAQWLGQISLEC